MKKLFTLVVFLFCAVLASATSTVAGSFEKRAFAQDAFAKQKMEMALIPERVSAVVDSMNTNSGDTTAGYSFSLSQYHDFGVITPAEVSSQNWVSVIYHEYPETPTYTMQHDYFSLNLVVDTQNRCSLQVSCTKTEIGVYEDVVYVTCGPDTKPITLKYTVYDTQIFHLDFPDEFTCREYGPNDLMVYATADGYTAQFNFLTNNLLPGRYSLGDFNMSYTGIFLPDGTGMAASFVTVDITESNGITYFDVYMQCWGGYVFYMSMHGLNPGSPTQNDSIITPPTDTIPATPTDSSTGVISYTIRIKVPTCSGTPLAPCVIGGTEWSRQQIEVNKGNLPHLMAHDMTLEEDGYYTYTYPELASDEWCLYFYEAATFNSGNRNYVLKNESRYCHVLDRNVNPLILDMTGSEWRWDNCDSATQPTDTTTTGGVSGATATFDFANMGLANQQAVTEPDFFQDGVMVHFDKGSNSNAPKFYTSGMAVRVYGANFFMVAAPLNQHLSKIMIQYASGEGNNPVAPNSGYYEEMPDSKGKQGTWVGDAETVIFNVDGTSGHRRISSIEVTFGPVGGVVIPEDTTTTTPTDSVPSIPTDSVPSIPTDSVPSIPTDTTTTGDVQGATAIFDFANMGLANQQAVTEPDFFQDGVMVHFDKGSNSNAPKFYTSGMAVRVYGANFFMVAAPLNQHLSKIMIQYASGEGSNPVSADCGYYDEIPDSKGKQGTWVGDAENVTFTIGGTSGHRRVSSIEVTFGPVGGVVVPEDTISLAEKTAQAALNEVLDSINVKRIWLQNVRGNMLSLDSENNYTVGINGRISRMESDLNDLENRANNEYEQGTIVAKRAELLSLVAKTDVSVKAIPADIVANDFAYQQVQTTMSAISLTIQNALDTISKSDYSSYAIIVNSFTESLASIYDAYEQLNDTIDLLRSQLNLAQRLPELAAGAMAYLSTHPQEIENSFRSAINEYLAANPMLKPIVFMAAKVVESEGFQYEDEETGVSISLETTTASIDSEGDMHVDEGSTMSVTSSTAITTLTITLPAGSVSVPLSSIGTWVSLVPSFVAHRMLADMAPDQLETIEWVWQAPQDVEVYSVDVQITEASMQMKKIDIKSDPVSRSINVSRDEKWTTFIAPMGMSMNGRSGLTAYTVTGTTTYGVHTVLSLTELDSVPANTPVLLYAENGYTGAVSGVPAGLEDTYTVGLLTGVYTATSDFSGYVLANNDDADGNLLRGFYSKTSEDAKPLYTATVEANHAYLNIPEEGNLIYLTQESIYGMAISAYAAHQSATISVAQGMYTSSAEQESAVAQAILMIENRLYDEDLSLDENKAALDAILASLRLDLAKLSAIDALNETAVGVPGSAAILSDAIASINAATSETDVNIILSDAMQALINAGSVATGLDSMTDAKTTMVVLNGRVLILRAGRTYDMTGVVLH